MRLQQEGPEYFNNIIKVQVVLIFHPQYFKGEILTNKSSATRRNTVKCSI